MRALITGGAGFIGSHVADLMLAEGFEVTIVDDLSHGRYENIPAGVKAFFRLDINDPALADVFSRTRPEVVIHDAAQIDVTSSMKEPVKDARTNITGSLALIECCRRFHVSKLIYASSAAVYGDPQFLPVTEDHPVMPMSCYGVSKHTVEHYLHVYGKAEGLRYTILRYANVFGPRQDTGGEGGVVAVFSEKMLRGEQVRIFGDGEQTRDFIYVEDVASANYAAIGSAAGVTLNISTGRETSVNELYARMAKLVPGAKPPVYEACSPGEIRRSVLDNTKARETMGWRPQHTLSEGLQKTLDYYRCVGKGQRKRQPVSGGSVLDGKEG